MQDVYTYYFLPNAIIVIGPTHFNSGFFVMLPLLLTLSFHLLSGRRNTSSPCNIYTHIFALLKIKMIFFCPGHFLPLN